MATTVLTGSRCEVEVEGANGPIRIGWGTDVRVDIRHQVLPIEALGNPQPLSVETVGVQYDVSVGYLRIAEVDPVSQGFLAHHGGDNAASIVNMPEMTIKVWAKHMGGDRLVCVLYGARPSQYSMTVQARGLVGQNVTFAARAAQFTSEVE